MPLSYLPAQVSAWFSVLASVLDKRSAPRLAQLLLGALFAQGRRTVTSWLRAARITTAFRHAYNALFAAGRRGGGIATQLLLGVLKPLMRLLPGDRLLFALDDTPGKRYGPCIQGAGIHHNPTPGPAGEKYFYGQVWVTLAWLAPHPLFGVLALPLQALLYVRDKDVPALNKEYPWTFKTKLQLAVELVGWLLIWLGRVGKAVWLVVDGAYANAPFLRPLLQRTVVVVSRLRKDAHLLAMPATVRQPRQRGPLPTYGKKRISLAQRAGQQRGWQQLECVLYGEKVVKTIKTFLATWHPAGGAIRVVLVKEEDGWMAFFCTDSKASAKVILEAVAARGAIEQMFKEVKEVWGGQQQQVRNVYACVGAFNLNLWMYSLVEAWAWSKSAAELCDRRGCPWDSELRRPSHADKRKALQRQTLQAEIEAVLSGQPTPGEIRVLAQHLLDLAA
jgi:DDE superfamily endonuclease